MVRGIQSTLRGAFLRTNSNLSAEKQHKALTNQAKSYIMKAALNKDHHNAKL